MLDLATSSWYALSFSSAFGYLGNKGCGDGGKIKRAKKKKYKTRDDAN